MPQAVSRRLFTVEARVQSTTSPCEVCNGRSGTGTGFSGSTSFFSLLLSFHQCSTLIFTYTLLLRGQTGKAGNLPKISALSEIGKLSVVSPLKDESPQPYRLQRYAYSPWCTLNIAT